MLTLRRQCSSNRYVEIFKSSLFEARAAMHHQMSVNMAQSFGPDGGPGPMHGPGPGTFVHKHSDKS